MCCFDYVLYMFWLFVFHHCLTSHLGFISVNCDVDNLELFCLNDRQEIIYEKSDKGYMGGENESFYPLKYSERYLERVLQLVSEDVPHIYTHTPTTRIEYERTAAAVGCIPAVLHNALLSRQEHTGKARRRLIDKERETGLHSSVKKIVQCQLAV